MHGEGRYTYPDGAYYVGSYAEGNKHGRGCLTRSDGTSIEGVWKNDKLRR
jgi:hypothetical protein